MPPRPRPLFALLAATLLAAGAGAFVSQVPVLAQDAVAVYKVGDRVERASVTGLDGKEAGFADTAGKVAVLHFYSPRCTECDREAPELEKRIWQGLREKGVAVVGVTRDAPGARKFQAKHGLTYALWVDRDGVLFDRFVDRYVPWNAVIDREGKLVYSAQGWDAEKVEAAVKAALETKK